MSHFNLNNGMPRRRYIGPTHGLPCRPGTASLENLGGRIIIENEMHNHKLRLKQIKPSIDASKPWAHNYQDTKLRKMSPSRSGGEGGTSPNTTSAGNNTSLPPASRNGGGYGSANTTAGGRSNSSVGRGGPAAANASRGRPSPTSGSSPASPSNGGQQHQITFDVTALTSAQQQTYTDLVTLLSTLPQREAKSLLEQAYREGEERKLLMAYTGGFAGAKGASSSGSGMGDSKGGKREKGASHNQSSLTAAPGNKHDTSNADRDNAASASVASSRPQSSRRGGAADRLGASSSSQLRNTARDADADAAAYASSSRGGGAEGEHYGNRNEEDDNNDRHNQSAMSASRLSSSSKKRSVRSAVAAASPNDEGYDSFEKEEE